MLETTTHPVNRSSWRFKSMAFPPPKWRICLEKSLDVDKLHLQGDARIPKEWNL